MNVTFIGTAGSFISSNRTYPSILINNDLLLDCGEGTTQKLLKINCIKQIKTVCLTHLHNDHFMGIFSLIWFYSLNNRTEAIKIIGPPKTKDTIEKILELTNTPKGMLNFDLVYIELEDSEEIQNIKNNYKIKAIKVDHSIMAFAFRIEDADKSVSYSGDTAPSQNLTKLAENSDLLICESTFSDKYGKIAHKYGHSTPLDMAKLTIESNSKKLALVHIMLNIPMELEKFKLQAEQEFKNKIIIAEDLMEIKL